jgi:hypothetical protein
MADGVRPATNRSSSRVRVITRLGFTALVAVLLSTPGDPAAGQVRTTAVWLFDEHEGLYPSSVLHDAAEDERILVLGRGGRIVPGRYGNALEIIDPEPLDLPAGSFHAHFGITQLPVPAGRSVLPMSWANARFAALATSGEPHLRKDVGFIPATSSALNPGPFDWTVEFWYRPSRARTVEGVVFELGTGPRGENDTFTRLALDASGDAFRLTSPAAGLELVIPTSPAALRPGAGWAHYAFVYAAGEGQLTHYVNGVLQPLSPRALIQQVPPGDEDYFTIGRDGTWGRPLYGSIDELRFSTGQVYTGAFKPPVSFVTSYVRAFPHARRVAGPPLLFTQERRSDPVVALSGRKHLFLDDALLARAENVTFAVNPPRVDECVVPVDGSFRKHLTVLEDEDGRVRLYTAVEDDYLAVWISDDGRRFTEIETGLEHRGRQNIVIAEPVGTGTVLRDPNAPSEAAWKYVSDYHRRGLYVYVSPDGLSFERQRLAALPFRSGSQNDIFYDDQRQTYVGFHRTDIARTPGGRTSREFVMSEMESLTGIWPYEPVSDHQTAEEARRRPLHAMLPWYLDNGPLTPSGFGIEFPTVFAPDPVQERISAGIYNPKALKYPWAPDAYVAFPVLYFHYYEGYPGQRALASVHGGGPVETQFAASRDGVNWTRYPRPAYVGIGRLGGMDVVQTFIAQGLIRRGDEIWQYAFADADYHTPVGVRKRDRCVFRLVQRMDGFVSLDSPYGAYGEIVTRPITFEGNRLVLNIDTDAHGYALVGLLDENDQPISGYEIARSVLVNGDFIEHEVEWLDVGGDISHLGGRTVRLMIRMRGARLYSIQFQSR